MRAMYSGISGMKVNQTRLDVIGNNIANVGTTAFKGSRARFEDSLSQAERAASAPSTSLGGTNAGDVGLGVQLAGIDKMMQQGNMQPTGRALDCAIDGNGFFMVSKGKTIFDDSLKVDHNKGKHVIDAKNSTAKSEILFTRDGAFTLDQEGNLLTSDGYRVMGYGLKSKVGAPVESLKDGRKAGEEVTFVDASEEVQAVETSLKTLKIPEKVATAGGFSRVKTFSIDKQGIITAQLEGGKVAALGQIAMAGFSNPEGLTIKGKNLYSSSVNSGTVTLRSGAGAKIEDNSDAFGAMLQGNLEMSNVDLAEQFTDMIVTSRAFQANGKIITTGDELLQDIINLKR